MELNADEQFFYDNAGWSEPPGREECARELARAEEHARRAGWYYRVEDDGEPMADDVGSVDRYRAGEISCFVVILFDADSNVLASLGNVTVENGEGDPYIRTVKAELASEAMS